MSWLLSLPLLTPPVVNEEGPSLPPLTSHASFGFLLVSDFFRVYTHQGRLIFFLHLAVH